MLVYKVIVVPQRKSGCHFQKSLTFSGRSFVALKNFMCVIFMTLDKEKTEYYLLEISGFHSIAASPAARSPFTRHF